MTPAPLHREGARVLVMCEGASPSQTRMLLLRGHDPHQPDRSWWFTPGGGVEAGETALECALRELEEETGLVLAPDSLEGPIWDRTAMFDFMSTPYTQHEVYFVARVAEQATADRSRWTATELETLDDVAWMTRDEVRGCGIEVFPAQLRESWDSVLDWNGETRELGVASE